jgi:hypothetical protein
MFGNDLQHFFAHWYSISRRFQEGIEKYETGFLSNAFTNPARPAPPSPAIENAAWEVVRRLP